MVQVQSSTATITAPRQASSVDVSKKSRIVIVQGNRVTQQAALAALRSELAKMTETVSFSVGESSPKEAKLAKQFAIRWITRK